ncbi:MAG: hypothetical protein JXJ04_03460 [Spirochaetales bacterium]|nr:hypothetical protein [Spirochaetales bacterium]
MVKDEIIFTQKELQSLDVIIHNIETNFDLLIQKMRKDLLSCIYENIYTLHPNRIYEVMTEEAETFLSFLKTRDKTIAGSRDKQVAREGLGETIILSLFNVFRDFFLEQFYKDHYDELCFALKITNIYVKVYFPAFNEERNLQIYRDQD